MTMNKCYQSPELRTFNGCLYFTESCSSMRNVSIQHQVTPHNKLYRAFHMSGDRRGRAAAFILSTYCNMELIKTNGCEVGWRHVCETDNYGETDWKPHQHYSDVIMSAMTSQITGVSSVGLGTNQRKYQASLAFVWGIRWPVTSPHKRPVTRKIFSFDDVNMIWYLWEHCFLIMQIAYVDFVPKVLVTEKPHNL